MYPLSILSMKYITSKAWRKIYCFESLGSTMRRQLDVHDTVDLISVISSEIHIDVTSTFMESSRVKEAVIASLTHVHSRSDTSKNLAFTDLKDRVADIAYIKFSCCLSGASIVTRILQPDIDLQFNIKLP